jgi:hypothetical protein
MKNKLYFFSLLIIALSIFLIIEYPNSGRVQLIAGAIVPIGFGINLFTFFKKI